MVAESCGAVRFSDFDSAGEPIGRRGGIQGDPPAWVQVAACSEDQVISNVDAHARGDAGRER